VPLQDLSFSVSFGVKVRFSDIYMPERDWRWSSAKLSQPNAIGRKIRRYSRVREKLSKALHRLATREGDVRQRLRAAHWVLTQLRASELPPELREDWQSIMNRLTRLGPERDPTGDVLNSALEHTMQSIRNSTGRAIANDVYRLYMNFVTAYGI
jgi:hypothetical protein